MASFVGMFRTRQDVRSSSPTFYDSLERNRIPCVPHQQPILEERGRWVLVAVGEAIGIQVL